MAAEVEEERLVVMALGDRFDRRAALAGSAASLCGSARSSAIRRVAPAVADGAAQLADPQREQVQERQTWEVNVFVAATPISRPACV